MTRAYLRSTIRDVIKLAAITAVSLSWLYAAELPLHYSVTNWGHKDGLPSTVIYSMAQSRDGFLWLGTDDGLVRFDGVQFSQWHPTTPESQLPGQVRALHVSQDGELLLGTETGLFGRIRNGVLDITQMRAAVRWIDDGADGSIWVATTAALWHLAVTSLQPIEPSIDLPRGWVSGPQHDSDGRVWITTHAGVFYVQAGRLVRSSDASTRLVLAAKGHLASLDEDGYLRSLETGTILQDCRALSAYVATITTMLTDSSGSLWVGTKGDGIIRCSTASEHATLQRYTRNDGLSSDFTRSLFQDEEQNLWVGTGNGLARLRRDKVVSLTMRDGLLSDSIASIASARDGSVWLATADGLERRLDGQRTVYQRGVPILSLAISSNQELWAGTTAGLMRMSGGQLAPSGKDEEFRAVTALAEGDRGVLWFYDASRGVFQQPSGHDPIQVTNPALQNHKVTSIASGPEGVVWFGNEDGSVVEDRNGEIRIFSVHDGLSGGAIHELSVGSDGELWAATERGLCFFAGSGFRCRSSSSGLPGDRVLWVIPDAHGKLWLGYNIGVAEIKADALRQTTSSLNPRFFDEADGIADSPALNGNAPAAFAQDGRLWLTTSQGVAVLDPEHFYNNVLPPPVHVLRLEADGNAVDITRPIRLPPLTRSLHFLFTGLSFTVPRKMRFCYRLEPFDREWHDSGSIREASYTNLPPGHYTFRVRASNSDGVWNDTGAALSFFLVPAYFQTAWFRLLCVAVALLAATLLFRLRLRSAQQILRIRFEERMEERTRIARELHDHLIQEMVGIGMQLEIADELTPGKADAKTPLQRALVLSRTAIANGRLTLQTLRRRPSTGAALLESLRQTADAYPRGDGTEVEYRSEGQEQLLRPEVAEDLIELGQEALRNALRHAGGAILVLLRYGSSTFELLVRDNGSGITDTILREGVPGHYGLAGMRERASRIEGQFSIRSSPGQGTRVQIVVPASRAYQDRTQSDQIRSAGQNNEAQEKPQ
jgi:signal transduction histidine kinase/ligand-binding sensor domain-containing protein